jgi:hypothetical protein
MCIEKANDLLGRHLLLIHAAHPRKKVRRVKPFLVATTIGLAAAPAYHCPGSAYNQFADSPSAN